MASLRLSDKLTYLLDVELNKCDTPLGVTKLFSTPIFSPLFDNIKVLLSRHHYVHISNVVFAPRREVLEGIANMFGTFRSPVENTNVRVDCAYDGCSIEALPLHNDDAILDIMPAFGVLQVENECPLKMPTNGIVLVDELVDYLKLHNAKLLEKLLTNKVPMLSSKTIKIIKDNEVIFEEHESELFAKKSILFKEKGIYQSRFSLGRINYYYFKKTHVEQSQDEKNMITEFIEVANKLRKSLYLKQNDILIYNNKRILHDRSESAIEIGLNGEIKSRSFYIAFAT